MEEAVLPNLAFSVLEEAEDSYKKLGTFNSENLESLYSLFGESFTLATELLEKCKVIVYKTEDGLRNVFKLTAGKEQHTIYDNINFCHCETFRLQVLDTRRHLTCKHILAVQLAKIMGQLTVEVISGSHFVDFLNEQLNFLEEEKTSDTFK